MKAVILAGGIGSRISEESMFMPKPMIEIGDRPIIWHIIKMYAQHGIREFIVCCGYKGYMINRYFMEFVLTRSDVTFDLANNSFEILKNRASEWKVTCVNTGQDTMTGCRIKRIKDFVSAETFCLTYGDGVSDINLTELIRFHKSEGRLATITAVQPPGRWGAFSLHGEESIWEQTPLENLAKAKQLSAYRHLGCWQPMDTLRDKNFLASLWHGKKAPWKTW